MGTQPDEGDFLGGRPVRQPGVPPQRPRMPQPKWGTWPQPRPGQAPNFLAGKLSGHERRCPTCGQPIGGRQPQPAPKQQPDFRGILAGLRNVPRDGGLYSMQGQ
jgi:hypothetical protein